MTDTTLYVYVLTAIERHDRQNPITGKALGEMFGVSERRVQEIVRTLRLAGRKVAASMGDPFGYYLARTPEEMLETAEVLRVRGREYFQLANKLLDFGGTQPTIFEQEVAA